ncbi:MAG: hypothetical protein JJD97_12875, partial [Gemmatimonadaceae bacterium]|nr:hypothetical protein [Gemmatimonadaceae bacterium]
VLESDAPGTRKNLDRCIMRSADPLGGQAPNRVFGFGRIDVLKAIHCGSLN